MIGDLRLEIGDLSERIRIIEPASFFEIIRLEKNAAIVMTDSGGGRKRRSSMALRASSCGRKRSGWR